MDMLAENTSAGVCLSFEEAQTVIQIIDRLCKTGSLAGDELLPVGYIYNRLRLFIEPVEPKQQG